MRRWVRPWIFLLACAVCAPAMALDFRPIYDYRLRFEAVDDLPGDRELERTRFRLRGGFVASTSRAEIGLAVRVGLGSDSNATNAQNLDNEKSDGVQLDRLFLRYAVGERGELLLGKDAMPALLGPMIWDEDLRPVGLALTRDFDVRRWDTLTLSAGYLHPDHPLETDFDARLAFGQLDWAIQSEGPRRGAVTVSYLGFDELDSLPGEGLSRTNTLGPSGLAEDFRLIDIQGDLAFDIGPGSLRFGVDASRNTGAEDDGDGVHGRIVWNVEPGPAGSASRGWQVGFAYQRVQRDAVLAAFASDDWWFPSAMRGSRLWGRVDLGRKGRLQLSLGRERRDDLSIHTTRALLDWERRF